MAQAELRKVLAAMGARVIEGELAVGQAHENLDPDGSLVDEALQVRLGARDLGAGRGDAARPGRRLDVSPEHVVPSGSPWRLGVSKPPSPKEDPDEVAR